MLDHPAISLEWYTSALVAWFDGGLHFFEDVPGDSADGIVIFDVYYAMILTVFLLGLALLGIWRRRGSFRIARGDVLELGIYSALGGLLGARLAEVIFYNPGYFLEDPLRIVTSGAGSSIHGVVIGVPVAMWLWSRKRRVPLLHLTDQAACVFAVSTCIGRMVNWWIGELYGRAAPDWLPWAMRFRMLDGLGRPVVGDAAGATYSWIDKGSHLYLEPLSLNQGHELLAGASRSRLPVGSPDSTLFATVQDVITDPRHPVQLYQSLIDGLLLFVLLLLLRRRVKHAGVLTAAGIAGYGVLRFGTEFFRQPEVNIGFLWGGLTMGQFLCLGMVAAGGIIFWIAQRRPVEIAGISIPAPVQSERDLNA